MNMSEKTPNVLVFITDQQRSDWMGCVPNSVIQTPNIDRLSETGMRFSNAYCANPVCMPSRATLLTGLLPSDNGVRANGIPLSNQAVVLPEIFRSVGYQTALIGKPHQSCWWATPDRTPNITSYNPADLPEARECWEHRLAKKLPTPYFGFENSYFVGGHSSSVFGEYLHWLQDNYPKVAVDLVNRTSEAETLHASSYKSSVPEELYYTEWITQRSLDTLDGFDSDKPFFMWCSYPDPHEPFGPPAPWHSMYDPKDMSTPIAWNDDRSGMPEHYSLDYYTERAKIAGGPIDTTDRTLSQVSEMKALAFGMISLVDQSVGRIYEKIKHKGIVKDTIIIFLSDHGELMGDHGILFKGPYHYQGVLKVPLIFSWPGFIQQGKTSKSMVSLLDFMPTILELSGIHYPQIPFDDWVGPRLTDSNVAQHMYQYLARLPGKSLVPVLTGKNEKVQDSVLIENDEDYRGLSLRTIITESSIYTHYAGNTQGELFNLVEDPEQRTNIWSNTGKGSLRSEMEARLLEKIIETQGRHLRQISVA